MARETRTSTIAESSVGLSPRGRRCESSGALTGTLYLSGRSVAFARRPFRANNRHWDAADKPTSRTCPHSITEGQESPPWRETPGAPTLPVKIEFDLSERLGRSAPGG